MSSVHLRHVEIPQSLMPDESIVHAQCVTKLQNMVATTIIVFWRILSKGGPYHEHFITPMLMTLPTPQFGVFPVISPMCAEVAFYGMLRF